MQGCRTGDTPVAKGYKFSLNQCPKGRYLSNTGIDHWIIVKRVMSRQHSITSSSTSLSAQTAPLIAVTSSDELQQPNLLLQPLRPPPHLVIAAFTLAAAPPLPDPTADPSSPCPQHQLHPSPRCSSSAAPTETTSPSPIPVAARRHPLPPPANPHSGKKFRTASRISEFAAENCSSEPTSHAFFGQLRPPFLSIPSPVRSPSCCLSHAVDSAKLVVTLCNHPDDPHYGPRYTRDLEDGQLQFGVVQEPEDPPQEGFADGAEEQVEA
ncbi:proline-rich protein 36-like [Asparagus officinalis]|uniref:proline-rich protein 36-like n=1 Tax=Asparagus officinalis TaxID=4686 RepID=UPI00098DEEDC|nr:proline-rich protein 36-like [Asparagus officinalis]